MRVSVNKAKLTGLWAKNCANIQLALITKIAFGPNKSPGLSRNGPQRSVSRALSTVSTVMRLPFSDSHTDMQLIPLENIHSPRDSVRKARESHLIDKAMTLEPHGLNRRDELL